MACIAAQQTEEEMGIDGRDFYVNPEPLENGIEKILGYQYTNDDEEVYLVQRKGNRFAKWELEDDIERCFPPTSRFSESHLLKSCPWYSNPVERTLVAEFWLHRFGAYKGKSIQEDSMKEKASESTAKGNDTKVRISVHDLRSESGVEIRSRPLYKADYLKKPATRHLS
ncbi:MAG: hypothetical protein LQ350_007874 [Teloschistes chrysophthalmus]|nr:MAG: hypothetical protein LQ350_007874 [Niorma chrysophthalma]